MAKNNKNSEDETNLQKSIRNFKPIIIIIHTFAHFENSSAVFSPISLSHKIPMTSFSFKIL